MIGMNARLVLTVGVLCFATGELRAGQTDEIAVDEVAVDEVLGLDAIVGDDVQFRAELAGTQDFTILMGDKPIGQMQMSVSPAAEGSLAVYAVKTDMRLKVGPTVQELSRIDELDGRFALVRSRQSERESNGESTQSQAREITRTDDGWQGDYSGSVVGTLQLPFDTEDHWSLSSAFLILRTMKLEGPAGYAFRGVDWSEEEGRGVASYRDVKVSVLDSAPFPYQGKQVMATQVRALREGDETMIFAVSDELGVVGFWPEQTPIRFVAGTRKPSTPASNQVVPEGSQSPTQAVVQYLMVLAKERPVAHFDAIMDWGALYATWKKENPNAAPMTAESFGDLLKGQFEKLPKALEPSQVESIRALIAAKVEQDRAEVVLPGRDADPFRLVRRNDRWWITHFPR